MVEQSGEPFLFPLHCGLPRTAQSLGLDRSARTYRRSPGHNSKIPNTYTVSGGCGRSVDGGGSELHDMLCEIHDPHAHELLEMGRGLGYVSRWAATQASHVTVLGLSEEHLAEADRMGQITALLLEGRIVSERSAILTGSAPNGKFV